MLAAGQPCLVQLAAFGWGDICGAAIANSSTCSHIQPTCSGCSKRQSAGGPWLMLAATWTRWLGLTTCRWLSSCGEVDLSQLYRGGWVLVQMTLPVACKGMQVGCAFTLDVTGVASLARLVQVQCFQCSMSSWNSGIHLVHQSSCGIPMHKADASGWLSFAS